MKKYIIHIVYILLILAMCGFGWHMYKKLTAQMEAQNVQFKLLSDELARASNQMVTKTELNKWAKDLDVNLGQIKKDLNKMGADLVAVGQTVASIEGKIEEDQGSDNVTPHDPPDQPDKCELCDINGYTAEVQSKDIDIGSMPYGSVDFDASKKNPWSLSYDTIDVVVDTVVGETDNEGMPIIFYHTISLMNKSRPSLLDKKFKLKITSSDFKQTMDKTNRFSWWDPSLDLGLNNLVLFDNDKKPYYSAGAELGFSVMSWGKSHGGKTLRILRTAVGVNTEKHPYLTFEPVRYNLGKNLPLINDLWLGAGVAVDPINGSFGFGLSIGTGL